MKYVTGLPVVNNFFKVEKTSTPSKWQPQTSPIIYKLQTYELDTYSADLGLGLVLGLGLARIRDRVTPMVRKRVKVRYDR